MATIIDHPSYGSGIQVVTPTPLGGAAGDMINENFDHLGNILTGGAIASGLSVLGTTKLGDGGTTNYIEVDNGGKQTFVGGAGIPYGGIYVKDSVATVPIDNVVSTGSLVTQWTNNGASNNCTPDQANNQITIDKLGVYHVDFHTSSSVSAGVAIVIEFNGYLNGVEQDMLHASRSISSTAVGSISFGGCVDVTTVPWDLQIHANSDNAASRDLTVEDAQLNVRQVGGT